MVPRGRGNLVIGYRRNAATGIALCGLPLSAPNPGRHLPGLCAERVERVSCVRP